MRALPAALAVVACLTTFATMADEPADLPARHTRVAMFKNGLALVETVVDLPTAELRDGQTFRLSPLPPARFGSLWITWPRQVELRNVRSSRVLGEKQSPALNLQDLLRASTGKNVSVRVGEEWIEGTLVSVPQPEPEAPQWQDPNQHWRGYPQPPSSNLVVLQQQGGALALPLTSISQVALADVPARATFTEAQWMEALVFDASSSEQGEQPEPSLPITFHYIVQGLAWSPSYVVDITDPQKARISSKAVVVNDFADLAGVSAELVAGFPHLPSAYMDSAMALQPLHVLLQRMRDGAPSDADGFASNSARYMAQQARYQPADTGTPTMPVAPVGGQASEDLYFFEAGAISLQKGERLYLPLLSAEVPYTHCYTWDVPDYIDEQRGYQNEPAEQQQVVWHALRLTNTTGQPWTTAPGTTTKQGRVLGQDALHYTAPGANTDLRITQALSIDAQQAEQEVDRQRDAERFFGSRYDKVTVEGELRMTNYGSETVTVQVTKTLTGEVESSSGNADVVRLARGLRRVNPNSKITWNVDVPSTQANDEPVTLTYRYTVYVRN